METGLTIYHSNEMALAISGLDAGLHALAETNVATAIRSAGADFTPREVEAMVVVEELRLLGGFDLYTLLRRGERIRRLEGEGLLGDHPGNYQSLDELAGELNISPGELSDTRALTFLIFPYIEDHGHSLAELWDEIGKSAFRAITPILSGLITGHENPRATVQNQIRRVWNMAYLSLLNSQDNTSEILEDHIRDAAIELVIDNARGMNVRELRTWLAELSSDPDDDNIVNAEPEGEDLVSPIEEPERQRGAFEWVSIAREGRIFVIGMAEETRSMRVPHVRDVLRITADNRSDVLSQLRSEPIVADFLEGLL